MSFASLYPLAAMAPAPDGAPFREEDGLALLPHHESARLPLAILRLLGGVYYTKLGHYGAGPGPSWFAGAAGEAARASVRDLEGVERVIEERNRTRRPYVHLMPSRIPRSINI